MAKKIKTRKSLMEREQDGLYMEVMDEVRHEKTMVFLKKWGKLFGIIAVVLLGGVLISQVIGNLRAKQQMKEAAIYQEASSQSVLLNATQMTEKLEELAKDGKYGYQAVAYFKLADMELTKNNVAKAEEILKEATKKIDQKELRDLAILKLGFLTADKMDVASAQDLLSPVLKKSSPFYYSANNLFGLICLKNNDTAKAKEIFEKIANDDEAPADIRTFSFNALTTIK